MYGPLQKTASKVALLSSASKNKTFCSFSPPLPPTSHSPSQQHKSLRITVVKELPEAAAKSYTLLCPLFFPLVLRETYFAQENLCS